MAQSTQQTTEHLARTADNLPGPALPRKEAPPSSPPCCSTAHRITLHLELTHSGRSSARFGGRISVSASLFPPACSPLAGDGSAGCRRRRRGGEAWAGLPQHGLPRARATSPSPALPRGCPCPAAGRLPLCPQQRLAGQGGSPPARLYVCGWEGGGPAPNYIKNISMLWLSLLRCPDSACPLPLGKGPAEGVKSRLGCLKASRAPCSPCSPAWHGAAHGAEAVLPHVRGQTPSPPNAGSSLQHRMCVPHSCSSEQLRGLLTLGALSPLPEFPSPACERTFISGGPSSGFLYSRAGFS